MNAAVARDGGPVLTRGPAQGSAKRPNEYKIHTTPVHSEAHGVDWLGFFNSRLSGPPFTGYHNGNEIVVECWPKDEDRLVETVDAAIDYANQRLRDMYS
jgi:hypothetical protein